jgi:hypothetical protein
LASDADKLEESYEDWLAGAQRTLVQLAVTGVRAKRVDVDVDALVRWCESEGHPLDSAARAAYAAVQLRAGHEEANPERTCPPPGPSW